MFKLSPAPANESDVQSLEQMWHEYSKRTLWKRNQLEAIAHDEKCRTKCVCRTRQQEVHEWEDFAMQNFDRPWLSIDWGVPEAPPEPQRDPAAVLASLGIRSKRV